MQRTLVFIFLFCVFGKCLCEERANFKGYRVIRATPANEAQLKLLTNLEESGNFEVDFWTHPSHVGAAVDIRVSALQYPRLAKLLESNGIIFTILIPDVQDLLESENPPPARSARAYDYGRYNRLTPMVDELRSLVSSHPNLASLVEEFGTSYEKRTIYAVKISSNPNAGRKTFFINCGIHAREWITPATCMFMINQMLKKYGKDASVTNMVDRLDWVIMPVFNVDGYEFTHTGNRMWRKTMSRNSGSSCLGTDPNRNWNFGWAGVGTSSNPCRDTYHGPRPFSEIEVRNVARYLYKNRRNLIGYMDIHAYSQLWMTPWGYKRAYPKDYTELKRVSDIAVNALYNAGYRTQYRVGPSSIIIYANSGSTKDWAYGILGVRYSFALELRDKGQYGFLLPANQIIPTGLETFAAIKAMGAALKI
ncbi:carboxypeptidase B [Pocillopora verrucosa]|uniref:carboxypeptidase B n=1 Tax=Pocillopora verrucosa TaxID=203993 RepID=UPI002797BBD2|nr:carboxypeptidase B-like [Pocillopora verrucosa]